MLERFKAFAQAEPVALINAVVAVAAVAAGLGLDVDPEALGAVVGSLLVLTGITRASVYAPANVEREEGLVVEVVQEYEHTPHSWEDR